MRRGIRNLFLLLLIGSAAVGLFGLTDDAVLSDEGKTAPPVALTERTLDPAVWGKLYPRQYEEWQRTAEKTGTKHGGGGSETMATDRLAENPRLKILFDGYAFSVDYRARRGHAYMLSDQRETQRVKLPFRQSGACLQCHSSNLSAYRDRGIADGAPGAATDPLVSPNGYAQLLRGFEKVGRMPFEEAAKLMEHPLGCIDCHDPKTMKLRVTRPGFLLGIRALAASEATAGLFPSIMQWRAGSRAEPYDPNVLASRQEMRSFVCGQCHSEYYCGPDTTLFYPWNNGLRAEDMETYYNFYKFPDGRGFSDWKHVESGADLLKAQHPEFELWSQGLHARTGVSCADCHMPSRQEGESRSSNHWVRSPLLEKLDVCQDCHQSTAEEVRAQVDDVQERTHKMLLRAEDAVVELIKTIVAARSEGIEEEQLIEAREFQRGAQWRVDFISSENSMGIHASSETFRLLAEAMDLASRGRVVVQNMKIK